MQDQTKLDKSLNWFKNKRTIVIFVIFGIVLFFISNVIDSAWKIRENLFGDDGFLKSKTETSKDSLSEDKDEISIVTKKEKKRTEEENPDASTTSERTQQNSQTQDILIKGSDYSFISGRLIDIKGNGIPKGFIKTESGEETQTDEFGNFELRIKVRKNQLKVFLNYGKPGMENKGRYVGVEQRNITLKF